MDGSDHGDDVFAVCILQRMCIQLPVLCVVHGNN